MRPKIRATVVCIRSDRVLLVSKDAKRWALPGGRPDKKELLADTALRELVEETGLRAKTLSFRAQFLGATTVHHVFEARVGNSAEARPCNEIKVCQWVAWDELDQFGVSLTTKQIIAQTLA